jgi:hypothetical protein
MNISIRDCIRRSIDLGRKLQVNPQIDLKIFNLNGNTFQVTTNQLGFKARKAVGGYIILLNATYAPRKIKPMDIDYEVNYVNTTLTKTANASASAESNGVSVNFTSIKPEVLTPEGASLLLAFSQFLEVPNLYIHKRDAQCVRELAPKLLDYFDLTETDYGVQLIKKL